MQPKLYKRFIEINDVELNRANAPISRDGEPYQVHQVTMFDRNPFQSLIDKNKKHKEEREKK
jgi:hypothetical protein